MVAAMTLLVEGKSGKSKNRKKDCKKRQCVDAEGLLGEEEAVKCINGNESDLYRANVQSKELTYL